MYINIYIYIHIYIYKIYLCTYTLSSTENCQTFFQCFTFTFSASEKLEKTKKRTRQLFTGFLNHGTLDKKW